MPKGENHWNWSGDNVGYHGIHTYVRRRLPRTKSCEKCNSARPMDLANKSGKYLRDLSDWEWLCRKCHMLSDGRMNNLNQYKPIEERKYATRRTLTYKGETKGIAEWAREIDIPFFALMKRIQRGWDASKAIETPLKITTKQL